MGAQGKIFISYRREDAPGDARGICDRLGRSFGEANVFIDVDRLLAGQRFDRELEKALAKCDVLIAVIGSRWLEILSEHARSGKRDYVRDEIAAALKRDIVVIPVMIGREGHMPSLPLQDDLPENIRELVLYQKHNIVHESFGRDAAELIAAIKLVLGDRRGHRPWRAIAIATVIGLLLTAALLGYSQGIIPWIGPSGQQQSSKTNDATIAALPNSDAARKVEETRQKAEADAKVASDAASKKAAGVAQDAAGTRVGYEKAAALGNTNAMVDLGIMYENGRGVSRDFEQARKWYEQAAALGNAAAMYNLGLLYQNALRDSAQARKWYEKAAEQGHTGAMRELAGFYAFSWDGPRDYAQARKWYEKAAALGDASALTNFLSLCWRGYGVSDSDLPSCYGTAAGFGSVNAMFNLGSLYEFGTYGSVAKDTDQARKWYQKAADAGYEPAKEKLKTLK